MDHNVQYIFHHHQKGPIFYPRNGQQEAGHAALIHGRIMVVDNQNTKEDDYTDVGDSSICASTPFDIHR